MVTIVPSLPAQTFQELETKVGKVRGLVDTFQIDIADGLFVTSRSWPMNPGDAAHFSRLTRGEVSLPYRDDIAYEVHFMAHNPEKLLPDWIRLGIVRALFHIEARHDVATLSSLATKADIELGISLKVDTPVARIEPYLPHVSLVQLMGIASIGTQGQPFDERVLDTIRAVKERFPGVTIQVDGSVNADTAPRIIAAGADVLAPGSYIFSARSTEAAIETLRNGSPRR